MSIAEARAFMSHGTRTGKLATTRPNGRPHVAAIWFVLDGADVLFTTGNHTVKAHNMVRTGRAAMLVDSETPPFAYVLVEGTTTISKDLAEMLQWATQIGGRYMGEDEAERFGRRNAVPGEWLVRLHPEKLIARDGISD